MPPIEEVKDEDLTPEDRNEIKIQSPFTQAVYNPGQYPEMKTLADKTRLLLRDNPIAVSYID